MFIIVKCLMRLFFVEYENKIFHNDKHTSWWSMTFILYESTDTCPMFKFVKYENHPSIGRMFIIAKYSTSSFFVACKSQIFCNDTHPSWWRMIFILHELNHWICVRWFVKYENHPSMGRMFIIVEYPTHLFLVTCKNQTFHNDKHPSNWRMIFILHKSSDTCPMI